MQSNFTPKSDRRSSKARFRQREAPNGDEVKSLLDMFNQGRYTESAALGRDLTERFPRYGFGWKVLGAALKQQGLIEDAVGAMRKAAGLMPEDAETQSNLGAALKEQGLIAEAEACYHRALAIKPDFTGAHYNLANMLKEQGRDAEAEAGYRRVLAIKPDYAEAHINLGNMLEEQGRLIEAEASYRRALEVKPDFAEVQSNLGNVLKKQGRAAEAEACYRRTLEVQPAYDVAHTNLSNLFKEQGRFAEAEAGYRRVLAIKPDDAEAHITLGIMLAEQDRLMEAEACYRRALALKPDSAEAHCNLGVLCVKQGRHGEAEISYRKALDVRPDFAEAHCNLGTVLLEQGRSPEAEESYRRALAVKPDLTEAHSNLAGAIKDQGRLAEAEVSYRRALEIKPDYHEAHCNLGSVLKDQGRLTDAEASFRRALEIKPDYLNAYCSLLFALNYDPDKSAADIFSVYKEFDARFGLPHREGWQAHGNPRETNRRLKVGYVSPDFRRHSTCFFLEPLLAHHDKRAVEIYAYAELTREDDVTARYKGYADHWASTRGMSDEALAARIRDDGIDILVDLAGHTGHNRLEVFARKPAPVSVSWLGYGYTTGLTAIDYLLTDAVSAPAGSEGLFSEQPWRLETPGYVYRPGEGMGDVSPLPALERGFVTFGTLTRAVRINHRTIRVWSEILQRVAGSRLVIDSRNFQDPAARKALAERFARQGIGSERLEIGFHTPPWDVLRGMDIGLDCFPHNSGTTLFETLYMGVPYVTLAGRPSVGRLGSTILEGAGHPEWIAGTEDEYVEKAVALAADLPQLATLRAGLRQEMEAGPLRDEVGFARKVERAYQAMFAQWAGSAPYPVHELRSSIHPGREEEARAPMQRAAELLPDDISTHSKLGNVLLGQGRSAEAEASFRRVLEINPNDAAGHNNLGTALLGQDLLPAAEASFRRALEIMPDSAVVYSNLGNVLHKQGLIAEAETICRRAVEICPDYAEAHYNLGIVLQEQGLLTAAEASYRRALQIKPCNAEACYNLSVVLQDQGLLPAAEASYRQVLQIKENYAPAHLNLGVILREQGRLIESEASYRRVLEVKPDSWEAHYNVGSVLKDQGRLTEAEASYRRALEIKPDYLNAYCSLLFALNYDPDKSAADIFSVYQEFDIRFGLPHREGWQAHFNPRETNRRLKVGYVSGDFRWHSTVFFLEPLLAQHDKRAVEVYAYAELIREDAVTARYKEYVDHWAPTRGMSDDALAARIRDDGIDILVDLAGHTGNNRLGVFARKPAPVSVSWLGYGYTTGLTAIDYLLTDAVSAPAGSEGLFSERPWRLETPGYVYRPGEGMGDVSPLPALERGFVTFGTLTRAVRINHRTIRAWSEILQRVAGSRLVIDSRNFQDPAARKALAERFARQGIGSERLEIGFHSPPWDVLRGMDIGLDCFPHNSGTTLFETLYMGVPYVTLAGRPSVGRLGSTVLEGLGHPEWIAGTEDEYVEKAAALAADLPKLAALRAGLRQEMETGPLRDEVGFARKVERAYQAMFAQWAGSDADRPASQTVFSQREEPKKEVSREEEAPNGDEVKSLLDMFNRSCYAEAAALGRGLTERFPRYGFAWKVLGAALKQQGLIEDAVVSMRKAAELMPQDAETQSNLGAALKGQGLVAEAEACYRSALAIKPDFTGAHYNLANLLKEQGRDAEAEAGYRRVLSIKPDSAEAHINLGNMLEEQGRLVEAETCYRHALEVKPDFAEVQSNLGNVLKKQGRAAEAEACYRRTVEMKPAYDIAHYNLANMFKEQGRYAEAEAGYRRVLSIKPDDAEAHAKLGATLENQNRFTEAEFCYQRALEIKPDHEDAFSSLLFILNYDPDKSAADIFSVYQEFDVRFGLPHREKWKAHFNPRETNRRLKVGYVSGDFRKHPVSLFLEPLLAHHDKGVMEVYAYAELAREDAVTARYKGYADHWTPTRGMSDDALAARIRDDGIDVLVDLAGHTAYNRLGVFARKPAPVSVSWLGYGYTTGLTAIDYLLTDAVSAPAGSEGLFSEQPWRLETPGYVYRPGEGMGDVSPLPALERGFVTFGTLTRSIRINYRTVRAWSAILQRVAGSRLVIDSRNFRDAGAQKALADRFARQGIGSERLEIGFHTPPWDVLRGMDIGLDCFPHNSGTTLFETLYMGVPYVTLAGRPSVGRLGSTVLEGLGRPEWIAGTEDEYVEKAVALAADLPQLAARRAGLRQEMEAGPLRDEVGFARKVERAYQSMFAQWAGSASGRPASEAGLRYRDESHREEPKREESPGEAPTGDDVKSLLDMFNRSCYAEAAALGRGLTERFPRYGLGWKVLGAALKQQGLIEDAVGAMRKAAELMPQDAETQSNLGAALKGQGLVAEAEACYRSALAIKPGFTGAHYNLANLLKEQGRDAEAEAGYRRVLAIKPDSAEAHINLGNMLEEQGRLVEAETSYRHALEVKPDFWEAHYNLGSTIKDQGRLSEAEASFQRALAIKPDYENAFSGLLFVLNYDPDKSGEDIFLMYREYNARFGLPHREGWQAHENQRETNRRLKVGYVSPDLRLHAVRFFLEPLLAHHDKRVVEIYAYAELAREDAVTARYKGYADHWAPTRGMSDDALAARIREDGIDILVDLAGHTGNNRLEVFARKPAPVSVSWLGYGYTTGLTAIDYLLTDAVSAPAGSEGLFSEQPWRLETPGYVYRPGEGMGDVSPLPALERGFVTFGTLTRSIRINHRTIRAWSAILQRVAGSRLVIDSRNFRDAGAQKALADRFARQGIGSERLEIGFHSPPWDVLRGMDIGLDCFPHNSGTTLFESLYMGVPYVTLAGRPSVGRLGSTVLEGLGHPEWIAGTEDEYVEKAVALAADLPQLAARRAGLRQEMEAGPLRDEVGFARKVERAYQAMFAQWAGSDADRQASQTVFSQREEPKNEASREVEAPTGDEVKSLLDMFNRSCYDETAALARGLTERFPRNGFGWKVLGAALKQQGLIEDAVVSLRKAAELMPQDAETQSNLGAALKGQGLIAEAESCYRQLVVLQPDSHFAHFKLSNMLNVQGRLAEAEAGYRRALAIKPDYAAAHINLGSVLHEQGLFLESETCFCRAMDIKPDFQEAHCNLGNALKDQGRLTEAEASFRRALEIKPDYLNAYHSLLFTLNYHPDKSAGDIFSVYQEFDVRFGLQHREGWQAHDNPRETDRRLKVGYVSPDFRRHSVGFFLEPLLAHHDKRVVEVYAYAELAREDAVTARYKGYADHWASTRGMSDEALAARIRDDGIDILVDLAGHTGHNRLEVFARKPAPVSVSWLGYGYTTGLTAIDYLLTDAVSAPAGSEGLFSEQPWRLETPGYVYRPGEGMGDVSPLPALERGFVTFGTLTRAVRINHRTIRVWSEILQRVAGSRLVIDSLNFQDPAARKALADRFAHHGIVSERLEIGSHTPPWDVLRGIDIGLDCFPHNSGTTLFETLYMGVPYVTLAGRPSVGRLGSTVLEGLGHPEWIAGTEDEYVEKAVALAADLPQLAARRAGLRQEMEAGPLRDEVGFARKVESAYQAMFAKWAGSDADRLASQTVFSQREEPKNEASREVEAPTGDEVKSLLDMFNRGCYDETAALARGLTERFPRNGFGWKVLGAALKQQGLIEDAVVSLRKAAELMPQDAETQSNLGAALKEQGLIAEAESCYRQLVELQPDSHFAHFKLSNMLNVQGRLAEAEAGYRRAIAIKPDYAAAHINLGSVLHEQGLFLESETCFCRAMDIKPDFQEAHCNLGNALKDQGRLTEAEASFRRALEIKPDYLNAYHSLLFTLNYHPDKSAGDIFSVYQEFDVRFGLQHREGWQAHDNPRETDRRLKVGYVSPDFRRHSVGFFLEPLLAHHDKRVVEVYAYAELAREDAVTARYKGYADHWASTRGMSDEALAARIRDDGIDILVDLAGHTGHNRLEVFARKPAPVSVSWLGYGYTTGLTAIDYLLTDAVSAPAGSEGLFSEQPWRLETPGYVYRPGEGMGDVSPLPALERGFVTFGTLTRAVRINHRTIRVWSEILQRVAGSRLVIDSLNFQDPAARKALADRFAHHGIVSERLEIGSHTPPWDVLRGIDIGLDCFPHNSGTTLFETLYMGVPYVTLAGRPSVGRLGSTVLEGLGHPEWIAGTEDEYVEKAVVLAYDLPALASLRTWLRSEMEASPLMDEAGFARKVEAAYREMWRVWVDKF